MSSADYSSTRDTSSIAYIQSLHSLNEPPRRTSGVRLGIIKLVALEIPAEKKLRRLLASITWKVQKKKKRKISRVLGRRVTAVAGHPVHLLNQRHVDPLAHDRLHHGQMLEVIVRLEERITSKELD